MTDTVGDPYRQIQAGEKVKVTIVSPGAIGSALGRGYVEGGARVLACVVGRSQRTRAFAHGLELVDSLDDAVGAADIVLSVVPPGEAVAVAGAIGRSAAATGVTPLVADLNAIAPATVGRMAAALAGLDFVDGSISGPPPDRAPGRGRTRLYLSGPRAGEIAALAHPRLERRVLAGPVGAASALKMSTASLYKGLAALFLQATAAAQQAGVLDVMLDDLAPTFPDQVDGLGSWLALSASKAHRYVAEMREIAATQAAAGLPPELFEAMAVVWERVARSPLGALTPEQAGGMADAAAVIRALGLPAAGHPPEG
ncbi:NAD(P)-dependent oxidoreductase [Candidatus Frankia alpina]|uniref:NAD(P)-dependent oxidoreductase n=1 Tax=Candidatus Frankia alpina TaxID=2699483 RepID=A0A4S5ESV2_9ACTN|nr:NAD(P)-dependent oxidoreductase [Candidatus Frankia alpina]THJ75353.1 NAD(P)-dependent oxidoreductase [Candidatus Frankia alpina]